MRQARILGSLCGARGTRDRDDRDALRLLVDSGTCPEEKVRVVPHGAPTLLIQRARAAAIDAPTSTREERLQGRFVLSTFGCSRPARDSRRVLEALPAIIEEHPETVYVIAGRTHPGVAQREGERYRLSLQQRVAELGLTSMSSSTTGS